LRRVQPSQAQLLNNISRSSRARFKKRKRCMALHIAPPSSRLKKQSPRREEDQPEGDRAMYAKRRVTRLQIAHKLVVLTRGGLTAPKVVRPGMASTMKNHRSEEKKTHP
jgi:hypothetical protein